MGPAADPGGVTPGKANFFTAWNYVDEQANKFLYLGFDREESGGNVFLAFELNQDTRSWDNNQPGPRPSSAAPTGT